MDYLVVKLNNNKTNEAVPLVHGVNIVNMKAAECIQSIYRVYTEFIRSLYRVYTDRHVTPKVIVTISQKLPLPGGEKVLYKTKPWLCKRKLYLFK